MDTIHQIWIGSELPEREQKWVASVKAAASEMGFKHHLWSLDELKATYPDEPIWKAVEPMPDCVRKWTLMCDFFRLIVIEPGDLYLDTDFTATRKPEIDFDNANIIVFGEFWDGNKQGTGIIGLGRRFGRTADLRRCARMKAERLTVESLNDLCAALGPEYFRHICRLHGFNFKFLPRTEATHVQWKHPGALIHMGAGAWVNDPH